VRPIDPHIDVLAPGEIAPAKLLILFLPGRGQPRDVGRRQPGRVLAQQRFQRGTEIAGGESAQIENRRRLGDFGRTAHIGRQDLAGEALAAPLFIAAAVSDPRRLYFHGSCSQRDFPDRGAAVAHHQGMSIFIARAAMALGVSVGLRLQRRHQHPPRALARDLVQRPKLPARFPIVPLLDYLQPRWPPPSTRLPPGVACAHAEGYAAFFMPSRSTTFGNSSARSAMHSSSRGARYCFVPLTS
jgi:hypothetical protein